MSTDPHALIPPADPARALGASPTTETTNDNDK